MRLMPPVPRSALRLIPIPHALVDPLLGAVETGAEEVVRRLAWVAAAVPDRQLEQLMRTPAGRVITETIFLIMPRYLNTRQAAGLDMAIRWRVRGPGSQEEPDVYDLIIAERRCRVTRGASEARPLVTITVESTELLRLATGRSSPMQSYLAGRLSLRGDIMQAARLTSLFSVPPGPGG
ncbi:MAG TPA: SCP2 sterol-binding domain-containing protein [Solirubrobacteraceae bacterium]|jgi:alkyl sulfatase BDS1-like metallo-beta-lactamase superfamily hydrolase|nr:SCP2 sterol-binding domain-containing protein [Solirubrobacteraceae bacterium]